MNKQEELFSEWNLTTDRLKSLGAVIQNDFKRMLDDGYITKEQINQGRKDFLLKWMQVVLDLFKRKREIDNYIRKDVLGMNESPVNTVLNEALVAQYIEQIQMFIGL